jgi:DNA-directed RNA polymerase subunit RPC12/RpoP
MYKCPWCGKAGFSFWEKQSLGPKRALVCPHCRRKVSVCWNRAQLAAIPVLALGFLGLIAGRYVYGSWSAILLGGWLGATLGMLFTAPLYHFYVPLVRGDAPATR